MTDTENTSGWRDFEAKQDAKYGENNWHCDDLRRTRTLPMCVLDYLEIARAPAHGHGNAPPLFATYNGTRVRVVMASRFGDVGITDDLAATAGYSKRVFLPDLTDFSSSPSTPAEPEAGDAQ